MPGLWAALLTPVKNALGEGLIDKTLEVILGRVLKLQEEQAAALLRIEFKVDSLLSGPFNAGVAWLESANMPYRTPTDRIRYIELAQEKFVDAQGQLVGHKKAISQVYVALTHGLLGHVEDFEDWLLRARRTADETISNALRTANASQGFFMGMFGRSKRATRDFMSTFGPNNELIRDLNVLLDSHEPIEWSAEIDEWEEWVPPIEQGESGWTKRRALLVRHGDQTTELEPP